MNEEDEAFEQLALKQGLWEHTSGWRKKQIMEQAFPNPHRTDISGMTLRDYFAAKAMQAHLSMPETHTAISTNKTTFQNVCGGCYAWADAMVKAREA